MKKLIPREERNEKLISCGIPEQFLSSIGNIDELDFMVEDPKGAYFYFPTMDYKIFSGFEVTPIFNCGEEFYALFEKNDIRKIVRFELENDEIYSDYGLNWNLLLMDILWRYFDLALEEDDSMSLFCSVGKRLGFLYSEKLYQCLNIPSDEISIKLENKKKWKIEVAEKIKIL
ncbi:hypothetical protein H0I23_08540 [Cellulophaga sp. HaHaR_3_176]|uniref:hypothetical protein n=1 Tax=Cellulophaga sp. HaHaR_3_176 TaxID=1942464 RepID=UPI001C1F6409|nr:hypothetical protein [Cellulophaga sp. HaHaR_3_176]QWX82525.1 hypothetical protein H0I23_08540 [Cellulophaga sp. HaHaR_3_176]